MGCGCRTLKLGSGPPGGGHQPRKNITVVLQTVWGLPASAERMVLLRSLGPRVGDAAGSCVAGRACGR